MTRLGAPAMTLAIVLLPTRVSGQEPRAAPERSAILAAATTLMQQAGLAALITLGEDGRPQARVVDAFPPEPDLTVGIAANPVTRKVAEIRRDPRVTLIYTDPGGAGYVTILGTAVLVDDPAENARRWKEAWAPHYRDKNHGDGYLLVHVIPQRLEIVSYAHGLLNDPKTWRPVTVEFP